MSYNTDLQRNTATRAVEALNALGIDTTTAEEPMTRWNRVREAVRTARTPDAAPLWEAVATGDQKKITKASTEYVAARAILDAAKDDNQREDTFRATALSIIKQLVKEAQPTARAAYNEAGADYTEAFNEAGGQPNPSTLITTPGGAELWTTLIQSAQEMTKAATVIKLAAEFGMGVKDQGSGLKDVVPFVQGIDDIRAVTRARTTEWLQDKAQAVHRDYAAYLIAGGTIYAGDLDEQAQEVQRLIDGDLDTRKTATVPDLMAKEEKRALARATKRALKGK